MSSLDLTALRVIAVKDIEKAAALGAKEVTVRAGVAVTPLASDAASRHSMAIRRSGASAKPCPKAAKAAATPAPAGAVVTTPENEVIYHSVEAERIKDEIIATGKKLWMRQYVDGNGGNISYRIGPNQVLCTPTLCSKYDLTRELICMVDLDGNQLAGTAKRTSEIFLHLEIYKAVPEAKGVVHCHPPHATAYAITGRVPPRGIIPEFDVFVGAVALSPYETPGTKRFAETVVPYVRDYNTVLLGNHGIVCWADTVTHAEWYAEVLETYCWTLTIASNQLGVQVSRIPAAKATDLLNIKKSLGLPDPMLSPDTCPYAQGFDGPIDSIAVMPPRPCECGGGTTCAKSGDKACEKGCKPTCTTGGGNEIESIVREVTDAVMAALQARGVRA
jgi:L-fuculose-phosphate aldolase